jgi:hypothetical protein
VRLDKPGAAAVAAPQVSLDKPGAAPQPDRPAVTLAKAAAPPAAPEAAVESAAVESATAPEAEAPEVSAPEVAAPEIEGPEVEAPQAEAPEVAAPEVEAPEPVELAAAVRVTLRKVAAAEARAEQPAPAGGTVTLRKPGPGSTPPEPDGTDPEATAELPLPVAAPGVALGKATRGPAAPASPPAPDGLPAPADYREAIGRIVRSADAGEHEAAADLALELERLTVAAHGPTAAPVLQVRQVRAHVSRLAGRAGEAADLYREVALVLLRAEGAEHPETQQAATNAEACWRAIADRAEALKVAPEIIELRAYLPGPDGRKLRAAERYLAQLAAAPSAD